MVRILIALIIMAATGLFFLLFSVTYASAMKMLHRSAEEKEGIKRRNHWSRILLFRFLGSAFIAVALLGIALIRYQNGLRSHALLYVQTGNTTDFLDNKHSSFNYDGTVYVNCDDIELGEVLQDCELGEAVLNVRDTHSIGRLSDLGCRIINYNPYETMYRVVSDCPAELYCGSFDRFYCAKDDLIIVKEYFQLND